MIKTRHNKTNGISGRNNRTIFVAIVLWMFTLLLAPIEVHAQTSVDNLTDLLTEISNAPTNGTEKIITLMGEITLPDGTTILQGASGSNIKILRGIYSDWYRLFTVNDGAELILENITIDGNKDVFPEYYSGSLVCVDGSSKFIMKDGAVLTNNAAGAVGVYNNSNFTMTGGKINGNTADSGGGVYVDGSSTFTMTGGEITDNTNTAEYFGGSVYVDGVFNLG